MGNMHFYNETVHSIGSGECEKTRTRDKWINKEKLTLINSFVNIIWYAVWPFLALPPSVPHSGRQPGSTPRSRKDSMLRVEIHTMGWIHAWTHVFAQRQDLQIFLKYCRFDWCNYVCFWIMCWQLGNVPSTTLAEKHFTPLPNVRCTWYFGLAGVHVFLANFSKGKVSTDSRLPA